MEDKNQTFWTDFILVGFSDLPNLRVFLFVVFLIIYLVTLSGNILVISVIYSDPHLHTPMYFFLTNLSFVDISYSFIMFPRMLVSFFLQDISIMLWECLLQVYFFIAFVSTEFFLLTIMSFDRYAAICNPLRYTMIMKKSLCLCLAFGAWVCGLLVPISHTVQISKFSFCKTHELNHFFCDIIALLNLSCTNTHSIETLTYILGVIIPIFSFFIIVTSYVNIISTIMKMPFVEGRQKAFSTCASHLAVVILFYGVLLFTYMRPASMYSVYHSKISSLAYIAVSPMCNPIIYTLKNKEFNNSFQRRKRSRILV